MLTRTAGDISDLAYIHPYSHAMSNKYYLLTYLLTYLYLLKLILENQNGTQ